MPVTRLRPRTARAIARWPEETVVYRRPFVRAFLGLFYGGFAALLAWLSLAPSDDPQEVFTSGDWWVVPLAFLSLGAAYLFGTSRLEIDKSHVRILNPVWGADVPLAQVTGATTGSTLVVETAHGTFRAWGVEAANVQVALDSYGTQGDLAQFISAAAAGSAGTDEPAARYRFRWPDPFFWAVALLYVVVEVLVVSGHA
jgi:hypothetical protein